MIRVSIVCVSLKMASIIGVKGLGALYIETPSIILGWGDTRRTTAEINRVPCAPFWVNIGSFAPMVELEYTSVLRTDAERLARSSRARGIVV